MTDFEIEKLADLVNSGRTYYPAKVEAIKYAHSFGNDPIALAAINTVIYTRGNDKEYSK